MEIEHVFLKEEIPESPVFPLLVNDFQFFPCFATTMKGNLLPWEM